MNSWYYPNLQMRKQSTEKSRSNIPIKCRCLLWVSRSRYGRRHSTAQLRLQKFTSSWKEPPEQSSVRSSCSELNRGRASSGEPWSGILRESPSPASPRHRHGAADRTPQLQETQVLLDGWQLEARQGIYYSDSMMLEASTQAIALCP